MLNSKTKTQCKPFALNLEEGCLKIARMGSLQGEKENQTPNVRHLLEC